MAHTKEDGYAALITKWWIIKPKEQIKNKKVRNASK